MKISYGPPGHRGVTHLMAVGEDITIETTGDRTARHATVVGLALVGLGLLTGSRTATSVGIGAAAAALLIRRANGTLGIAGGAGGGGGGDTSGW